MAINTTQSTGEILAQKNLVARKQLEHSMMSAAPVANYNPMRASNNESLLTAGMNRMSDAMLRPEQRDAAAAAQAVQAEQVIYNRTQDDLAQNNLLSGRKQLQDNFMTEHNRNVTNDGITQKLAQNQFEELQGHHKEELKQWGTVNKQTNEQNKTVNAYNKLVEKGTQAQYKTVNDRATDALAKDAKEDGYKVETDKIVAHISNLSTEELAKYKLAYDPTNLPVGVDITRVNNAVNGQDEAITRQEKTNRTNLEVAEDLKGQAEYDAFTLQLGNARTTEDFAKIDPSGFKTFSSRQKIQAVKDMKRAEQANYNAQGARITEENNRADAALERLGSPDKKAFEAEIAGAKTVEQLAAIKTKFGDKTKLTSTQLTALNNSLTTREQQIYSLGQTRDADALKALTVENTATLDQGYSSMLQTNEQAKLALQEGAAAAGLTLNRNGSLNTRNPSNMTIGEQEQEYGVLMQQFKDATTSSTEYTNILNKLYGKKGYTNEMIDGMKAKYEEVQAARETLPQGLKDSLDRDKAEYGRERDIKATSIELRRAQSLAKYKDVSEITRANLNISEGDATEQATTALRKQFPTMDGKDLEDLLYFLKEGTKNQPAYTIVEAAKAMVINPGSWGGDADYSSGNFNVENVKDKVDKIVTASTKRVNRGEVALTAVETFDNQLFKLDKEKADYAESQTREYKKQSDTLSRHLFK